MVGLHNMEAPTAFARRLLPPSLSLSLSLLLSFLLSLFLSACASTGASPAKAGDERTSEERDNPLFVGATFLDRNIGIVCMFFLVKIFQF